MRFLFLCFVNGTLTPLLTTHTALKDLREPLALPGMISLIRHGFLI
jgi:hypothetical protein